MWQFLDIYGILEFIVGYNECYVMGFEFDGGVENFFFKCVCWVVQENVVDYFVYWKMFDVMMACELCGEYCELVKGCGFEVVFMGQWSDGYFVQFMEVWVLEDMVV